MSQWAAHLTGDLSAMAAKHQQGLPLFS